MIMRALLRLPVARSGVAGGGRRMAWDGATEARAARRALARAAAVRAGRGRAGKALRAMTWSVIATPRFSCGPGHTWRGLQYTLLFVNKMILRKSHDQSTPRPAVKIQTRAAEHQRRPMREPTFHFSLPALRFLSFSV